MARFAAARALVSSTLIQADASTIVDACILIRRWRKIAKKWPASAANRSGLIPIWAEASMSP